MGSPGVRNKRGKCEIRWREGAKQCSRVLPIAWCDAGRKKASQIRLECVRKYQLSLRADRALSPAAPTLLELSQTYIAACSAPSTIRTVRSHLNKYWLEHLRDIPVDYLTSLDILAVVNRHMSALAPKSKRDRVGTLHAVLELAVPDYIVRNPASHPKLKFKQIESLVDPFTIEERDLLLANLKDEDWLFYMIRFYAGLRPGEVISLVWGDFKNNQLLVERGRTDGHDRSTTKNNKHRIVNLHPKLAQALRAQPRRFPSEPIICKPDGSPYRRYERFSKKLVDTMVVLGMRYRDPYNARHTCATLMAEAGMNSAYCAAQLGHSVAMFQRTYSRWLNQSATDREHAKWSEVN